MRILAISGSLQQRSSNTRFLEAARTVAPDGVEVVLSRSVGEIPHFRPDGSEPVDDAVAELRRELAAADAVLIATPEYAHAIPGSLKNALDWIVGSGELYAMPVAIVSAAPSPERGKNAREMLERTLRAQGAEIVSSTNVQISPREIEDLDLGTAAAAPAALDGMVPNQTS